jgi:hypothetical protein
VIDIEAKRRERAAIILAQPERFNAAEVAWAKEIQARAAAAAATPEKG